ncbi:MAG: aminotransferase class V-fold PLP-dependent enzyme [Archangiaceae bacterium]|nr:aminotransferase class V-fold PLP-dependent enzyme [Archangiaceae bacterium]
MPPIDRALFPALSRYAYLNAAASSPLATPVAEAAMGQLRESLAEGDLHFPRWLAFKETLRERLGALFQAPARQVAFTPSTSLGFHAVAELFWRRGIREVLTLDAEFPSTTVPLLARGLKLKVVKARPDGTYRPEDLEGGEAIALSAVQYGSGFAIDLSAVRALARTRKVPLAVNVAQALGQVPLSADGIDFLCGTSHKWLMGGYGTGFFYAREGWLEEHGLPWAGWLTPPESQRWQAFPGSRWEGAVAEGADLRTETLGLDAGGGNWSGLFAFGAALALIEQAGVARIHAHNLELQRQLREGLTRRGFHPNAPLMTGICVTRVKGDPLEAVRALLQQGVVVTPRAGGVRFSTHGYNDATDVERALEAIDRAKLQPAPA